VSTTYTDILVHYGEIALKGKNRPMFVKRLVRNIRQSLRGLPVAEVRKLPGRLWITAHKDHTFGPEAFARLDVVYGITSYSPVVRCGLEMEEIKKLALDLVQDRTYETFRVSARRAFKNLPFTSLEVNEEVGGHLFENRPAKVKLKGADLQVYIEMVPAGAYLYVDKYPGLGGLPVGVTGKVAVLLSGGIDSPVAAFRMMRRGCRAMFVHFHAYPFVTKASLEKALELAAHLVRYQYTGVLWAVPFGELQRVIVEKTAGPLRVVLYRRFMLRIAGRLAKEAHAQALVTGEALAQVASQTLTNMVTIDQAAPLPVLRPLVGYDKQEIVNEAQKLGTFETSIEPDQDCCQLFVPNNPETHAKLPTVEAAEAELDIDALVDDACARAVREDLFAPWYKAPKHSRTPA